MEFEKVKKPVMEKQQTNIRTKSMEVDVKVGCNVPCKFWGSNGKAASHAGYLRRLTQPYFLGGDASGLMFIWLMCCMMFIVTGLTMVLMTGVLLITQATVPEFAEKLVSGDSGFIALLFGMWKAPEGGVIYALSALGTLSFIYNRQHLRNRRWVGWMLLGAIVFILLVINILNTGIGFIARDLTNALVAKDGPLAYKVLMVYAACFIIALPIRSAQFWFTAKLSILWREWLTQNFIDGYMSHRAYYDINPNDEAETEVDNPDQRMSEDVRTFTKESLSFTVGAFDALLTFVIISVLRRSYGYAGNFFPYLMMAPAYLRGEIEYGSFIQAKFAFNMVEGALSFVVSNIDQIAQWWAGVSRLAGFQTSLAEINAKGREKEMLREQRELQGVVHVDLEHGIDTGGMLLHNVTVKAPGSEQLLVEDLTLSVGPGERLLVVGPSGCGKTSVLRVASGLWEPTMGSVKRPHVGDLLFVPQRPYMLLGSLKEQLCYPLPQDSFDEDTLRDTLQKVRLQKLVDRYPDLNIKQDWPRLLSLGEQQRLAFARLLLNAPRYAVLDEATSALDVATEKLLYSILVERGVAVISVGHRPTLADYHQQVLELSGTGSWRLVPAATYEFGQI